MGIEVWFQLRIRSKFQIFIIACLQAYQFRLSMPPCFMAAAHSKAMTSESCVYTSGKKRGRNGPKYRGMSLIRMTTVLVVMTNDKLITCMPYFRLCFYNVFRHRHDETVAWRLIMGVFQILASIRSYPSPSLSVDHIIMQSENPLFTPTVSVG